MHHAVQYENASMSWGDASEIVAGGNALIRKPRGLSSNQSGLGESVKDDYLQSSPVYGAVAVHQPLFSPCAGQQVAQGYVGFGKAALF